MFTQPPLLVPEKKPPTPLQLPKAPPKDIEEFLSSQQDKLTREERDRWPIECSASTTLLDKPLGGECPALYQVEGDVFESLEAVRTDLKKHSPWESTFLDAINVRLGEVEKKLNWVADRFVCDGHPLVVEGDYTESVAGGLRNITNQTFLTELCDMDLLNSRQLTTGLKERKPPMMKFGDTAGEKDERTVNLLHFPGVEKTLSLPTKLEPLPILDLVTKAQISTNLSKPWKKLFFTDASTSLLINAFWWIWLDYFKPDQPSQAALFDLISENFVTLLNMMGNGRNDTIFMQFPDCLSQAIYSAFCQACPGSNKVINSEKFLNYLSNLISEWITGIKVPPGEWKRWPRHLLDPFHTAAHSNKRPLSSAKGSRMALTDKEVMSLSMSSSTNQLSTQQKVQFGRAQGKDGDSRQLLSETSMASGSSERGSPFRSSRTLSISGEKSKGTHLAQNSIESSLSHIGPGPIFECVRFSILGRSPLLQHFMIRHDLADLSAPSGPTISRRQVKEVPPPSIGYKDLLKKSQEISDRKYEYYEKEMARSVQETVSFQKNHVAKLRKLEKQNKKILSHRHEVTILAERLLAKNKAEQSTTKKLSQEDS